MSGDEIAAQSRRFLSAGFIEAIATATIASAMSVPALSERRVHRGRDTACKVAGIGLSVPALSERRVHRGLDIQQEKLRGLGRGAF